MACGGQGLHRKTTLIFHIFTFFFLCSGARTCEIKEMRPSEGRLKLNRVTKGLREEETDSRQSSLLSHGHGTHRSQVPARNVSVIVCVRTHI